MNPYKTLGVSQEATTDEIKYAFRRLAKQYHPDTGNAAASSEKFNEIYDAYEILMDRDRRREFDNMQSGYAAHNYFYQNNHYRGQEERQEKEYARAYIFSVLAQLSLYRKEATKVIWIGFAWLIGGILVTAFSYSVASENGGSYIITWGAILFGGIQAVKGIIGYFKINAEIADIERNLWKKFDDYFGEKHDTEPSDKKTADKNNQQQSKYASSAEFVEPKPDTTGNNNDIRNKNNNGSESSVEEGNSNSKYIIATIIIVFVLMFSFLILNSDRNTTIPAANPNNESEMPDTINITVKEREDLLGSVDVNRSLSYIEKTYKGEENLTHFMGIFLYLGYAMNDVDDMVASIAHYQKTHNLTVDGIPGPMTMGDIAIEIATLTHGKDIREWIESDAEIKKIYGWFSEKVDLFFYFTSFEFDYDDNQNNGWRVHCYEVNLVNKTAEAIGSNPDLEMKYRKLNLIE